MINLTFSVEGLFTSPLEGVEDTPEARVFFENNGALITAGKTHCIFPLCIEFLTWLSSLKGIRISSFNPNITDSNEISFPELLKFSLESKTPNLYEKVTKDVRVISNLSDGIGLRSSYNYLNKEGYKDLSNVLTSGDLLENAVLIDTNFLFVLKNQEKHFLHIPPTQINNYILTSKTLNTYDSSGHKPLLCILSKDKNDCKEERFNVQKGKCILITLENEGFNLYFLDNETGLHKIESISKESNPELYGDLKNCKFENYKTSLTIADEQINQKVLNLVLEFEGKTTKICRRINRICYLAGILSYALEKFHENGTPVTDTIFNLQHIRTPHFRPFKGKHYTRNPFLITNEYFYRKGLSELKKINPNLNFSKPQLFENKSFEIISSTEIT